jgi:hypothetical protein
MGAGSDNEASSRFPSPFIKPDMRISRIRLSDWLHRETHERGALAVRLNWKTPSSPKTALKEKRVVPRDCTL